MSRHNTRNKNKRSRTDALENIYFTVLRKINSSGEITKSDVCQLYLVSKPSCQGCRANSKDSPNCFCGLMPPSNGARKTGLWQKMQDIVLSLGPDPSKDLRSSTDTPAGLTNLGATCYANSILQCLYMNTSFRSGIFSLELEVLEQHPVLDQLARLFAQLHSSKMAFVDSAPFIKILELDNGVQQDSHEFLTLFLSLLERSLSHSKVHSARAIVQDLFRGGVSHVTRCSLCGKDSEASSKMEDFYELELNIKGFDDLDESLDDYLSVEELRGENQYFCESCGARVDATRSIKLQSLPVVLNFQLKRYIFLPKTSTKKKVTSAFSFPQQLNMGKRLSNPSEKSFVYELSAILIHKGTAVNSGHYVAHIWDENSCQWWEFDDEHVSKLGIHPFGETSCSSNKCEQKSCSDAGMDGIPNGNHKQMPCLSHDPLEIYSSTDAYMLMYKRVSVDGSSLNNSNSVGLKNKAVPVHYINEIEELNMSYSKACDEFQRLKDENVDHVTERRQEVKLVLSRAPVHPDEGTYFWISTEWLRHWADSITPTIPLDNSAIQCEHGKVPVPSVHSMKRLSATAWEMLLSKYGGGPTFCNDDYCVECIKNLAKSVVSADVYHDKKASFKQLVEEALAGKIGDAPLYLVSRTWLVQWLRKRNKEIPCDTDSGPTTSLRCPHGSLLPEQASGAKRVSVPENLWLFLLETSNNVDPEATVTFPVDSQPCEICSEELIKNASNEDKLRSVKLKLRQNHEKLALGKSFSLRPGEKYYLVPSAWLTKWRAYVAATGKNISSSEEPESLDAVVESLICQRHSRLLQKPLELIWKGGVITQKASATDGLSIILESDWLSFCEEWNICEGKGISAEVSCSATCQEKMRVSDEDSKSFKDEANAVLESQRLYTKTSPKLCEVCIGERESSALMQKLNYCDEHICVYLVRGKEVPKSIRDCTASIADCQRRTSKRSRRTSSGHTINLKVSCTTTIYQLKMMIWEAFGVVKENQKLHKGSDEIEGDSATLADKNIFAGDVLWVMDSEIHENRDIADEIYEQKADSSLREEGFRGTLLTADLLDHGCHMIESD